MNALGSAEPHPLVRDFPWGRLGQPQLTPGQIADRGARSLRRLAEWGIALRPNNRLARAVNVINTTARDDVRMQSANATLLARLGEAGRTVVELYHATHGAHANPEDIVLAKFGEALKGGDLPRSERDHHARDLQFELYVWGLMRAAGIPVRFEEPPDLMFEYGDETVGIAVKRVWSLDQAKKRLSAGAKQVRRSGRRGLIATNVQEYLTAATLTGSLKEKGTAFNRDVRRLHGHLAYLAQKPEVLGLVVCGTTFAWQLPAVGKPLKLLAPRM